jgi:hypothetical protein
VTSIGLFVVAVMLAILCLCVLFPKFMRGVVIVIVLFVLWSLARGPGGPLEGP